MSPSLLSSSLVSLEQQEVRSLKPQESASAMFLFSQKPQRSSVISECFGRAVVTRRRKKKSGNTFRIPAGDRTKVVVFV